MNTNDVEAMYKKLIADCELSMFLVNKKLSKIFLYRFCVIVISFYFFFSFVNAKVTFIEISLLAAPLVLFLLLIRKKNKLKSQLSFNKALLSIYGNEMESKGLRQNLYSDGQGFDDTSHNYVSDLDIFGPGSIFKLINRCKTVLGNSLLANSLMFPHHRKEILDRHEAVQELNMYAEETFFFRANLVLHNEDSTTKIRDKFRNKLDPELVFIANNYLKWYVNISLPLLIISLLLSFFFQKWLIILPVILLLFNFFLYLKYYQLTTSLFDRLPLSNYLLKDYRSALNYLGKKKWKSSLIQSFFDHDRWEKSISALNPIVESLDLSMNSYVRPLINIIVPWDLFCSFWLEKWSLKWLEGLVHGLDAIGHFEMLISLSTFHLNNPKYALPILKDEKTFHAIGLHHPLIDDSHTIANDFEQMPNSTVNIVTGSNMAGKSTFLRTIGVNMVLAYAGAVVACDRLALSCFNVLTYMRIKDSISDGTSTFKAEIDRIKLILKAINQHDNNFILIDEMLRGTNSYDKFTASEAFIRKLAVSDNYVLFATHDLQLSNLQHEFPQSIFNYHFNAVITSGDLVFDYKLKNGPCKHFNAKFLLKEAGLNY